MLNHRMRRQAASFSSCQGLLAHHAVIWLTAELDTVSRSEFTLVARLEKALTSELGPGRRLFDLHYQFRNCRSFER